MNTSKDRILDAAERVVLRDGAAHLTLDAVAAEASMSKGGLLYHYPSKDELIRCMIARLQEMFESEMDRLAGLDPQPAGRRIRAYLNASQKPEVSEFTVRTSQISAALLAAVSVNPSLLEPLHERTRVLREAFHADGIDPVTAEIVRLATDGLWISSLFGAPPLDPDLHARVVARLNKLTRQA
ncbi:MAG: TetR/AcrR family transcriptional regulator [Acidobacteriota bacterium]